MEILRRSINLKLILMKLLCDYQTLIKRWSCDSRWALTLERQFISDFSLDFVLLLYRFRFFPLDFVFLHYRFRFISLDFVFLIYRFRLFSLYFVFLLYRFRFFSLDFVFLLYRFRWILFSFRFVSFLFVSQFTNTQTTKVIFLDF